MAIKKKRKLKKPLVPPEKLARPRNEGSGNQGWFGTEDRLTDPTSQKIGDVEPGLSAPNWSPDGGRAKAQLSIPDAFVAAIVSGDREQIQAAWDKMPSGWTQPAAAAAAGVAIKARFVAMPLEQRAAVVKTVDANADIFGALPVKAFKEMMQSAPPPPKDAKPLNFDPVALEGDEALQNMGMGGKALSATPGRNPDLSRVDPRLLSIVSAGASHLPAGYTVTVNEGYNASGHTSESQHHIVGKGAIDVQITGPNGVIPNKGPDTTGMYGQLARYSYGEMLASHPELKGQLAWGGAFGTVSGGSVPDLMHFDLGGERGKLGPHLSQLGAISGVAYGGAVAPVAAKAAAAGNVEAYIRQSAIARGIDPDVAVRVAKGEGGLNNPLQQSYVVKNGQRETSYGPFQLRIGGGLGDAALKAGIDPRKESDWQAGVDFALNHAAEHGWGAWYGAVNPGPKSGLSPISSTAGLAGARPVVIGAIAGASGQDVAAGGATSPGDAARVANAIRASGGLRKGSRDTAANKAIQASLNAVGATDRYGNPVKVDGTFGNRTKEAVQIYQHRSGLRPDGVFGPKTFAQMNEDMAPPDNAGPELVGNATGGRSFSFGAGTMVGASRDFAAGAAAAAVTVDPVLARAFVPSGKATLTAALDHPDEQFVSSGREWDPAAARLANTLRDNERIAEQVRAAKEGAGKTKFIQEPVQAGVDIPKSLDEFLGGGPGTGIGREYQRPEANDPWSVMKRGFDVERWLQEPTVQDSGSDMFSGGSIASDPFRPTGGSSGIFEPGNSGSFDDFASGMASTYQAVQSGGSWTTTFFPATSSTYEPGGSNSTIQTDAAGRVLGGI